MPAAGTTSTGSTAMPTDAMTLLRLQNWLSPAFPTGGYAYSHGLEFAVEVGLVREREGLTDWLDAVLRLGAGRLDAVFLAQAWHAVGARDDFLLREVAALAQAMRGSAELGLESGQQGAAFLATVAQAWPAPKLARARRLLAGAGIAETLPVAVGIAAAAHGLDRRATTVAYLQAFAANLMQAALRLLPLGQTDGQHVMAALEPAVLASAAEALAMALDDAGSATATVDWCAMRHETQYTRLFRS